MKNCLKKIFITIICLPVILLCSCGEVKPNCNAADLTYYYENSTECNVYRQSEPRRHTISSFTGSKVNKDTLDAYEKITITGNSARLFYFYIEYIYFKVYINEANGDDLNLTMTISNVISEDNVKKSDVEDTTYSNTFACSTRKQGSIQVKAPINRVVSNATGSKITIDSFETDIFINENTTFKWTIYDLKIYGESRAYN